MAERTPRKRAASRKAVEAVEAMTDAVEEVEEAQDAVRRAGRAAAEAAEATDQDDPLLDTAIRQLEAGADDDKPFGTPGAPLSPNSPYRVAFYATLGALTALVIAFATYAVRDIVVLIVISAFLAVGLNPAVEWLSRHGWRRGYAVAAVVGAVLLFFVGFVAAAVPPVARQVSELRSEIPEYLKTFRENATYRDLDEQFHINDRVTKVLQESGTQAAGAALTIAQRVLGYIFKTLTVLVLTLYFLSAYPRIKRGAYRMVPRSRRARVGLIADEILVRVGGYVLGNMATSAIAGFCSLVLFMLLDIPYPIALAMLVAIMDLIPLVGATIAAIVCTIVAFFVSVPVGIICLAYFVVYQQVENYVLVPKVMKRTVDVSPLATIVAALIGGTLLGVVGALLAIPVAAAIQLVGTEVLHPRQDAT